MAMAVDDTPRPQKTNTAVVTAAATNAVVTNAVVTNAVVTKTATTATPEPAAAPVNQAVEPQLEPESVAAAVTITGCLERGEGTFRLTDASGSDAPTKRSWKSGFLKKRAAHVELADGVGTLNLRNHVGRRVSATGTLVDRELRARSVRFVGPCE